MLIERLHGKYIAKLDSSIIVDVNGVGYGVELPLSQLLSLPKVGSALTLWTYTHVREDSLRLFGFLHYEDRQAFSVLLAVNGVGPKLALAILSTLSVAAIRHAVSASQPQIFESVPGVGKRMAEKLSLELKARVSKLQPPQDAHLDSLSTRLEPSDFSSLSDVIHEPVDIFEATLDDVHSALENLGFKEKAIQTVIKELRSKSQVLEFQDAMRFALQNLHKQTEKKPSSTQIAKKPATKPKDSLLF